jgi:hypothetical protein
MKYSLLITKSQNDTFSTLAKKRLIWVARGGENNSEMGFGKSRLSTGKASDLVADLFYL